MGMQKGPPLLKDLAVRDATKIIYCPLLERSEAA